MAYVAKHIMELLLSVDLRHERYYFEVIISAPPSSITYPYEERDKVQVVSHASYPARVAIVIQQH